MTGSHDITLEGVRVVRGGRTVLDIPALRFAAGRTTALFGPNGAGKTTLLRTIAALETPVAGAVRVGADALGRGPGAVAYAFQRAVFIRGSVRQNLALGLELQRLPVGARDERIAEAAGECGIAHLLDRPADQLSSGEAQRVNVARALCLRAPLTLLDEPLAGIDRATRTQLLEELPALLRRFAATTILVTHDRDEAFRLADDLVVLAGGCVLAAGSKRALRAEPPNAETAALLGYSVVSVNGRQLGVPPDGLLIGAAPAWGRPRLALTVESTADTGREVEVFGLAGGGRVRVTLPAGMATPAAGVVLEVDVVESVPIIFAPSTTTSDPR